MTVSGLALALWTTTSAASTLMAGLTRTFDREDERGFIRKRLTALAIVAALGLGAALVFGLLVLGPHLERWVGDAIGAPTLTAWAWWAGQWPVLVVALLFAFAVVLYFGPDGERPAWRFVTPGAVTALVVWLAASGGLSVYAAYFGSYEKTWGTLAAVIVTLLWLWLASAALLFGAEVNAQVERLAAERGDREGVTAAPTRRATVLQGDLRA
jgi:membrane protein